MNLRILGCSALVLAACAAHAAPGQVQVTFKIESAKFVGGLKDGPGGVGAVEQTLADHLATQLRAPFPLIEWLSTAPADAPAAVFAAKLVQQGTPIPTIQIVWSGNIGGSEFTMTPLAVITLYDSRNTERPYRNAAQLVDDVDKKLVEWSVADPVIRDLHDQFVTQVPLADRVDLDAQRQAIVIPLPWDRAKVHDDSVFQLEFVRTAPTEKVALRLAAPSQRLIDPALGATECAAASCTEGIASVANDAIWSKCVQVLLGANPPPLLVTVRNYKRDPHGGAIRPNGTSVTP